MDKRVGQFIIKKLKLSTMKNKLVDALPVIILFAGVLIGITISLIF